MDVSSWIGYAPYIVGTVALGILANRLDRGFDVVKRFISQRSMDASAKKKEQFDVAVEYYYYSKHGPYRFIIDASFGIMIIVIGSGLSASSSVISAAISNYTFAFDYHNVSAWTALFGAVAGIVLTFQGYFQLLKLSRTALAVAEIELKELNSVDLGTQDKSP